ncbi:MAG TPA: hypothetical protein VGB74_02470 [Actinoplanes sp.]|jgi:hypothetical protein
MRRTVLYTAGLIFAAGTSLGLAGPASAAPAAPAAADTKSCCHGSSGHSPHRQQNFGSNHHQQRDFAPHRQQQRNFGQHGQQQRNFGPQQRRSTPQQHSIPQRQGQGQGSTPRNNLSYLGLSQISIVNQIVLNNVGNPQIGLGNYNGGGSASATSATSQVSGLSGGW